MSELPPGWAQATIGEICLINPPMETDLPDQLECSFVPMARVEEESGRLDASEVRLVEAVRRKSFRPFQEGDVLVAKITPSMENGKGAVALRLKGGVGYGSTEFHVLRPSAGIEPWFVLRYVLQRRFREEARRHMTGTAGQLRVPTGYLRQATIPVPPLAEQRRIVAAIEEQFSRLDAADVSIDRVERRLHKFKEAALASALATPWPVRPLEDALLSLRNGIFVSRPNTEPPGVAIFRISAVRPLALDASDVRYAPVKVGENNDYLVRQGDLLFTRYSGNPEYVGACAVVPTLPQPTLHPDKLIRGVVDRSVADPAYLAIACSTGLTRAAIRSRRKTTAGQVGIAGGQLKTVPVSIPPLDEQRRIVAEVEQQLSVIDAMRTAIEAAQKRSAALRRSILELAFTGKLVAQDPTDEPASALLARIRTKREAVLATGRQGVRSRR